MLGIKYITRALPNSKLAKWQSKETNNKFVGWLKTYIFNDLMALIVHAAIAILVGILTNLSLSDAAYDVVMGIVIYAGLIPMVLNVLPYLIAGLIVNPIKKFIKWF